MLYDHKLARDRIARYIKTVIEPARFVEGNSPVRKGLIRPTELLVRFTVAYLLEPPSLVRL